MGRAVGAVAWLVVGLLAASALLAEPVVISGIAYRSGGGLTEYEQTRCKLDVYMAPGAVRAPVLVWYHGGGLTGGDKDGSATRAIARSLAGEGLIVVVPDYRLSPQVKFPAYIEDAAAAVGWAHANIGAYGGDAGRIYIGGHSAGGYLTLMVGLDQRWLQAAGVPAGAVAGLFPVAGQTMTHYTVREERGLPKEQIIADEAAPIHWARADAPPVVLTWAEQDMACRAEENQYLLEALRVAGHKRATGQRIAQRDHGSVADFIAREGDPVRRLLLDLVATTVPAP